MKTIFENKYVKVEIDSSDEIFVTNKTNETKIRINPGVYETIITAYKGVLSSLDNKGEAFQLKP